MGEKENLPKDARLKKIVFRRIVCAVIVFVIFIYAFKQPPVVLPSSDAADGTTIIPKETQQNVLNVKATAVPVVAQMSDSLLTKKRRNRKKHHGTTWKKKNGDVVFTYGNDEDVQIIPGSTNTYASNTVDSNANLDMMPRPVLPAYKSYNDGDNLEIINPIALSMQEERDISAIKERYLQTDAQMDASKEREKYLSTVGINYGINNDMHDKDVSEAIRQSIDDRWFPQDFEHLHVPMCEYRNVQHLQSLARQHADLAKHKNDHQHVTHSHGVVSVTQKLMTQSEHRHQGDAGISKTTMKTMTHICSCCGRSFPAFFPFKRPQTPGKNHEILQAAIYPTKSQRNSYINLLKMEDVEEAALYNQQLFRSILPTPYTSIHEYRCPYCHSHPTERTACIVLSQVLPVCRSNPVDNSNDIRMLHISPSKALHRNLISLTNILYRSVADMKMYESIHIQPAMLQVNTTKLLYADNSFDVVLSIHTLSFVPSLLTTLNDVMRVLKPGGKFIVMVPSFQDTHFYNDRQRDSEIIFKLKKNLQLLLKNRKLTASADADADESIRDDDVIQRLIVDNQAKIEKLVSHYSYKKTKTYESMSKLVKSDPEQRASVYGDKYIYRTFGSDFHLILKEQGFLVQHFSLSELLGGKKLNLSTKKSDQEWDEDLASDDDDKPWLNVFNVMHPSNEFVYIATKP